MAVRGILRGLVGKPADDPSAPAANRDGSLRPIDMRDHQRRLNV
jgi:hypothetical protein